MKISKNSACAELWRHFEEICAIPHPSGHERALAQHLARAARDNGLKAEIDPAGNLRIERPASPGCETRPRIILQAHLDMVPQAADGTEFNFRTSSIPLKVEGGFLRSSLPTTLGGDDGAGVAAALALLFDRKLEAGPLAGVFTVSEEVGLNGALALDPAFLDGDYLLNLDSEDEGEICIGCAGGARMEADFPLNWHDTPAGTTGIRVEITGLAGGHSGINIDDRRGNAVLYLARLLELLPELAVAALSGGTLDNVIPREAIAMTAAPEAQLPELRLRAANFGLKLAEEFDAPPEFTVALRPAARPARVWEPELQHRIIHALAHCPNGALAHDRRLHIVRTSSNLAAVHSNGDTLAVRTSQRSLSDQERAKLTQELVKQFTAAGAIPRIDNCYPGWEPQPNSRLLEQAQERHAACFGHPAAITVIHAGLECGILSGKRPGLQLISFGPTLHDPHSPAERLDIASTERFFLYLKDLVEHLNQ